MKHAIAGVRSRYVDGVRGMRVHVLEAGFETPDRPVLLLLHGFPELAWSWRKVMPALSSAGYRVIATDQRGYGDTSGWSGEFDAHLDAFRQMSLAEDAITLLSAMNIPRARAVIGHDFGSSVAAHCALLRPELFESVVLMSAPFAGLPPEGTPRQLSRREVAKQLAALDPPRKHYQDYFSTEAADRDMLDAPQGLHAFLRGYYHMKSADWPENRPHPLAERSTREIARLPGYYVMPLAATMPQVVEPHAPSPEAAAACAWLTDAEMDEYADAFAKTGFQPGLNWYRATASSGRDLRAANAGAIRPPTIFIAGKADWGVYQTPGALEAMQTTACADFRDVHLIEAAGHWVQQEQPRAVVEIITAFLARLAPVARVWT